MRVLLLLAVLGVYGQKAPAGKMPTPGWPDRVYTLTNDAAWNSLVVLQLDPWGKLWPIGSVPTGGMGSGMGMANQGALASWNNYVFAVNPGSNTITTFWTDPMMQMMPKNTSWVSSMGMGPRSLTVWKDWLFVLNEDGLAGFKIWADGKLTPVANSWQAFNSG